MRVAVASNFAAPMRDLTAAFQAETAFTLASSAASTGKHYAQIRAGAPFDVFLAADAERPRRLVEEGLAVAGSLHRYATGQLVLVAHRDAVAAGAGPTAMPHETLPACMAAVLDAAGRSGRPLAFAQPDTAPYGRAARETLERLGLWSRLAPRAVRGTNVSQALQFVVSGNASAAFVSRAQRLAAEGERLSPCEWDVPAELHAPIDQMMVVLAASADREAVRAFVRFMRSDAAARIVRDWGYAL